jgi:hypothetical protein
MVSLEIIALVLTGLSITASIIYYANILNNSNKTREAQFIQQITAWRQNPEGWKINEMLYEMEWSDYQDFINKYDGSNNPEHAAKRNSFLYTLDTWGHLMKTADLNREIVYDMMGRGIVSLWEKFKPIIYEMRINYFGDDDSYMKGFEYLYNEMMKVREKRGITGRMIFSAKSTQ